MRQIHTHGQLITELVDHFHMFEHNSVPIYEVTFVERTRINKKLLDIAPVAAMTMHLEIIRARILERLEEEEKYLNELEKFYRDLCLKS